VLKAEEEGIKDKRRLLSLPSHRLSKNVYSEEKKNPFGSSQDCDVAVKP
jgi:hypothetical protein